MALYQEIIEKRGIFQNLDCSPTSNPWHYCYLATFPFSVAFECEAGDVLSQGTLVTSPWQAPWAQRCTQFLYGFLIPFPGE